MALNASAMTTQPSTAIRITTILALRERAAGTSTSGLQPTAAADDINRGAATSDPAPPEAVAGAPGRFSRLSTSELDRVAPAGGCADALLTPLVRRRPGCMCG